MISDQTQISFDDIDNWDLKLSHVLRSLVSDPIKDRIRAAAPRHIDGACNLLFTLAGRDPVIDATLDWIRSSAILGYHGSRLNDAEIQTLQSTGLTPLQAQSRRERLTRALSPHSRWESVRSRLDAEIERHGAEKVAGKREGQVHLTLSRSALVDVFNHYLTHGSEFDQHVAYALLGPEGTELLRHDGTAYLVTVAVPGEDALNSAHPRFTIDDVRRRGDTPNIACQFLQAWSYRIAYPEFQSRTLRVDRGMVFQSAIPPTWIIGVETVPICGISS